MFLDHFRSALAQTVDQGVFFDNASMGPVIPAVTEAMCDCMRLRQSMPMKYYQYANEIFPACKTRLASLINASPEEIAFTENVAYGINCAAGSIPFSPGDNVIVCDREFSSNIYPWMVQEHQKGVHLRIIPAAISGLDTFQKLPSHHPDFFPGGGLTVALLERYADSRTRAVSLSSVEFCDGFSADLEAIGQWCRQRNIYLIVDCAQSLGVMPMDVKKYHIDYLAGLSSKWLLGPFSTGFLYVRKELLPTLFPPFAGADSVTMDVDSVQYRLEFKPDATRFETGLPNAPGIAGLNASLKFMEDLGFENIYRQAWEVSEWFIRALNELHLSVAPCTRQANTRSTIVTFKTKDSSSAYKYLRQHNIACSFRCGCIRTGIHGYNTLHEAAQVIAALENYLRKQE